MPNQKNSLDQAYEFCRVISMGHYENFPVGSILLPKKVRPHFFALYAFMRTADDFADPPERSAEVRLALLSDWRRQLDEIFENAESENPIFLALRNTLTQFKISPAPLFRLLEAFEFCGVLGAGGFGPPLQK